MTKDEALKLTLEALEQIARLTGPRWAFENNYAGHLKAITAIKEALAQRTWVGLTELEKAEITSLKWWDWEDTFDIEGFIRAIEAKLKEKNT